MTKEQLAEALNGREIGNEISDTEAMLAKGSGLLVIFGASDDLCELRGAINDEVGAYNGTTVLISKDGALLPEIERDDEEILRKHGALGIVRKARAQATRIIVQWCSTPEYSWVCGTTAPHATFDVMEDGEKYCRGIVLDLKELAQ